MAKLKIKVSTINKLDKAKLVIKLIANKDANSKANIYNKKINHRQLVLYSIA
jgi:hypothetical protein